MNKGKYLILKKHKLSELGNDEYSINKVWGSLVYEVKLY